MSNNAERASLPEDEGETAGEVVGGKLERVAEFIDNHGFHIILVTVLTLATIFIVSYCMPSPQDLIIR
ncbi:MAG: hypothetical protein AAB758_02120 [Patescibacteria group bacterium]